MSPRKRAYVYLLIVSLIWGIAGIVIKFTLNGFSPSIFLIYRFLISAIISFVSLLLTGFRLPKSPKVLGFIIIYGFLNTTVSLGLLFLGFDRTTAIDAVLISSVSPIVVAITSYVVLHEHITKKEKIGIGIAFIGTLVTISEPYLHHGDGKAAIIGNLLVFASVLVGGITAVMAKILLRKSVKPQVISDVSFIVGFISLIPIILIITPTNIANQITSAALPFQIGVLFMALLSGNLAYTLWHKAQKTIGVSEVGVFSYLLPVFTTPLAIIFLSEKLTIPFVIGAIIIVIGIIIAETKKK